MTNVESRTLTKLLKDLANQRLALPKFQRDEAWTPPRKIALWDSLLTDLPIGAMLITPANGKIGSVALDEQNTENPPEYLVLDGQQRLRAIDLAQPATTTGPKEQPKRHSRLWVDIEKGDDYNIKQLYICTEGICPWGADSEGKRPREKKRKEAREKLLELLSLKRLLSRAKADHQSEQEQSKLRERLQRFPDPFLFIDEIWPLNAEYPIPLDALVQDCLIHKERDIAELLPALKPPPDESAKLDDLNQRLNKFRSHLKATLEREIVLMVLQPQESIQSLRDQVERLGTVFERINAQGVPLTGAELFFSALKVQWPEARGLVHTIHLSSAGRILEPVQIVHLAVRLAQTSEANSDESGTSDVPKLERDTLHKLKNFNSEQSLSPYLQDGPKSLQEVLKIARKSLEYCPSNNRTGLPLPLLNRLDWRIWHTFAAWVDAIGVQAEKLAWEQRKDLQRYALLHHFYADSRSVWLTKKPFAQARQAGYSGDSFPGLEILKQLRDWGYIKCSYIKGSQARNGSGIHNLERYEETVDINAKLDSIGWMSILEKNEWDLIFWAQREALHEWFDGIYDPMVHHRRDDTPFDWDHILPGAWFDGRKYNESNKPHSPLWRNLQRLAHSTGNYRLWPSSLNRSDSDHAPALKGLILISGDDPAQPCWKTLKAWGMHSVEQVQQKSAIKTSEAQELSKIADNIPPQWNDSEVDAALEFITARHKRLFKTFYDELDLAKWSDLFTDAE